MDYEIQDQPLCPTCHTKMIHPAKNDNVRKCRCGRYQRFLFVSKCDDNCEIGENKNEGIPL
jgi:hypothetical protein